MSRHREMLDVKTHICTYYVDTTVCNGDTVYIDSQVKVKQLNMGTCYTSNHRYTLGGSVETETWASWRYAKEINYLDVTGTVSPG
jgi:hypothetical protein